MKKPDPAKLDAFMGKMLGDIGAAMTGTLVVIGDKLGLYKALAESGPLTSGELARRTGTASQVMLATGFVAPTIVPRGAVKGARVLQEHASVGSTPDSHADYGCLQFSSC